MDKLVVADLFLNTRLLTDGHFLRSQNANGTKIIQTFNRTSVDLCHYQVSIWRLLKCFHFSFDAAWSAVCEMLCKFENETECEYFGFYLMRVFLFFNQGQIRNNPRSKIVVSTCDGIKGFVYDGNETYSIEPNEKGTLHDAHYLFRWINYLEWLYLDLNWQCLFGNSLFTAKAKWMQAIRLLWIPFMKNQNLCLTNQLKGFVFIQSNWIYKYHSSMIIINN